MLQQRALHPLAWWLWAVGLAITASRVTNPLLLALILAVIGFVVVQRRSAAPWARAFRYYLGLALIVIAIRVVFRTVFASGALPGEHVLFRLPAARLPSWLSGITLGGPVSLEPTLAATFDGLRLGTLLCCIGAANVLANPKRALRVLPAALYEAGVAVVVALSVAPQLVESVQRVRRARRLRGGGTGLRAVRSVAIPVLEDALDRSLRLAAAMDSRGYGRVGAVPRRYRRTTAALLLLGLAGLCLGAFGLLDAGAPRALGLPAILGGTLVCALGLARAGRRVRRTRYRPDPWGGPEWLVTGGGVLAAAMTFVPLGYDRAALAMSLYPLQWPALPLVPVLAIALAGLGALAAPAPARRPVTPAREAGPTRIGVPA